MRARYYQHSRRSSAPPLPRAPPCLQRPSALRSQPMSSSTKALPLALFRATSQQPVILQTAPTRTEPRTASSSRWLLQSAMTISMASSEASSSDSAWLHTLTLPRSISILFPPHRTLAHRIIAARLPGAPLSARTLTRHLRWQSSQKSPKHRHQQRQISPARRPVRMLR